MLISITFTLLNTITIIQIHKGKKMKMNGFYLCEKKNLGLKVKVTKEALLYNVYE